jgi:hypothetical protein
MLTNINYLTTLMALFLLFATIDFNTNNLVNANPLPAPFPIPNADPEPLAQFGYTPPPQKGVLICDLPLWRKCTHHPVSDYLHAECTALPDSKAISFGPDQGVDCMLYVSDDCNPMGAGGAGEKGFRYLRMPGLAEVAGPGTGEGYRRWRCYEF